MASTVTYAYPVSGTTAPTATQSAAVNSLTAQVNFGDGDTTATVTHNWGLTTAQANNQWPWVDYYWQNPGTATCTLQIALTNTNAITVTKSNTSVGTGGTICVVLQRPHSIPA
jgi:hypothetical protein